MKYIKYLAIAMVLVAMVACGDDEPQSTYQRDFNMIYPVLPAGHKFISKIERKYDRGNTSVATASYDGDYLKSINVVNRDVDGSLLNEETITIDYKNGAIICDKKIQDVTYAFEVNSYGAFTKFSNVSTGRTSSAMTYDGTGHLEIAQVVTPTTTGTTVVNWMDGNLTQWVSRDVNKLDSVVYEYGTNAIPNKGNIDVAGNESFTFTTFVCAIMRNAGLFGTTSAKLPTVIKRGYDYSAVDASNPDAVELKRYNITYTLDAQGYVTSYTTNETPRYTVTYTYR